MKKNTIFCITIISTIFSILFIILSYYDILRYISLCYTNSCEKFIKNYSNLPKASENYKVIISFTTTPERINKIKPMINSLLNQSVKVDSILLITQYNKKYIIPEYLKDIVIIIPAGKNYGEATKLIPCLLKEKESDTIIISIKDNYIYGEDFIETMVDNVNDNFKIPLTDIKNTCIVIKPNYYDYNIVNYNEKTNNFNNWFLKNNKIIIFKKNYHY